MTSEQRWEAILSGMERAPDGYIPECDRKGFVPGKWVKFWPKVWLGDANVRALTDGQKALYLDLLLLETSLGHLPRSLREVSAMSRRDRRNIVCNFAAISGRFIVVSNDRLINRRAEKDRKNLRKTREKNRFFRRRGQMTDDMKKHTTSNLDPRTARTREENAGGVCFSERESPENSPKTEHLREGPQKAWDSFEAQIGSDGRVKDPAAYTAAVRRSLVAAGKPDVPPTVETAPDLEVESLAKTRREMAERRKQWAAWAAEAADPREVSEMLRRKGGDAAAT